MNLEVDLASGEIDGICLGWIGDPFERLLKEVSGQVSRRLEAEADEARKVELRKTHTWSNKRKGWVPNTGEGPLIRPGGSAPGLG